MTSKGAKETLVNKLGFKSSNSKSVESELEKVRKENVQLKKSLEEMSKRIGKPPPVRPDSDKAKLLERILSLETLREKNAQQLLTSEQEISTLRQQLRAKGGEAVASLQNQLEQKRHEAEQREKLFQNLSWESEDLKNKLVTITERCQALEKQNSTQVPDGEMAAVQEQLRDALEKNQRWLVYDGQREAYVQGLLARTAELEQQLNQTQQALQQAHKETHSEQVCLSPPISERVPASCTPDQSSTGTQREQQEQLQAAQRKLEEEQRRSRGLQDELDERVREAVRAQEEAQEERRVARDALVQERRMNAERAARLQSELEAADARLEEERKRAAELLLQVNLLQKSLLRQHEDQSRISVLEQQVQLSVKDSEDERLERQGLQQQLHKVLKELRKARDQITRLEAAKQPRESRFSEPSSYNRLDLDQMSIREHILNHTSSPVRGSGTLDESLLECPNCRTSYPTSQHRELLAHLDYCFN
ncbi:centrosomal protein of 55 kDa isoform X1 [Trichomycterus rosablanca]|uniref:centrosomal protein of 55 kDa isoform X1 n=1 Tax=Trichomycterus rosablanca TaxID=2290929 RepID=UPI002F35074C